MPVPELTSKKYAIAWRASIASDKAKPSAALKRPSGFLPPAPATAGQRRESPDTTHYSVVDSQGDAVAVTTTLNNDFGSDEEALMNPSLIVHPVDLSIVRMAAEAALPVWLDLAARPLISVTFAANETSIVCPVSLVPPGYRVEGPWRAFEIEGPIDFALTGVFALVLNPLAAAGLSIFGLSTYDTDWILVRAERLVNARVALAPHFQIRETPDSRG